MQQQRKKNTPSFTCVLISLFPCLQENNLHRYHFPSAEQSDCETLQTISKSRTPYCSLQSCTWSNPYSSNLLNWPVPQRKSFNSRYRCLSHHRSSSDQLAHLPRCAISCGFPCQASGKTSKHGCPLPTTYQEWLCYRSFFPAQTLQLNSNIFASDCSIAIRHPPLIYLFLSGIMILINTCLLLSVIYLGWIMLTRFFTQQARILIHNKFWMSIKIDNKLPTSEEEKQAMKQPYAVDKCPNKVQLEIGKDYWYCGCGLSKNQPFCDGSHKGTPFSPQKFTADKESAWICQCRQSKNKPFCDGTHKELEF